MSAVEQGTAMVASGERSWSKFTAATSKGGLNSYHKKKYVCKLLFIFLLGHDVDFGHIEAVNLLSSNKYTEKQIGYLFISVLLNEGNELIKLIIQNIKNDLSSKNPGMFYTMYNIHIPSP